MYIVEVVPIVKGKLENSLSYFTRENVDLGTLMSIQLRKKMVTGLVINIENAKNLKSEIRRLPWIMKKATSGNTRTIFPKTILESAIKEAENRCVPLGTYLEYLGVGGGVTLGSMDSGKSNTQATHFKETKKTTGTPEKIFIEGTKKSRLAYYSQEIKKIKNSGGTVIAIFPIIDDLDIATKAWADENPIPFHRSMSATKRKNAYKKICACNALILTTPQSFLLPHPTPSLIILESESSPAYHNISRSEMGFKSFINRYSTEINASCYKGDVLPSGDAWNDIVSGKIVHKILKSGGNTTVKIVDTNPKIINIDVPTKKREEFKPITKALLEKINEDYKNKNLIFLFTTRTGSAPQTRCDDCGTAVTCARCGRTLTLKGSPSVYHCNYCNNTESAERNCTLCGGWRLRMIGIGDEGVENYLKEVCPKIPTVRTNVKDPEEAIEVWKKQGGIAIGTEAIIPLLPDNIGTIGVVSSDSLLFLPEYNTPIRHRRLLLSLAEKTSNLIIQTKKPEEQVFQEIDNPNDTPFLIKDSAERKRFSFPPYAHLIRLKILNKNQSKESLKNLESDLLKEEVKLQNVSPILNFFTINTDDILLKKVIILLKKLPPSVSISIDPYQIFE